MEANKTTSIIYKILRAVMILFWIYVGMDKIWQLGAFRIALEQQPVISFLAPILFWLLPLMEIGIGLLLAIPSQRLHTLGWKVSTILIIVFTIYIGLGVLDVYAQKPCMCTSFLSHISWTAHLLINITVLGLSITGRALHRTAVNDQERTLTGKTNIAIFLIGFLAIGAITYESTHFKRTNENWYIPDSIYDYRKPNTVSGNSKGLLASTYDRYAGPYRQLFTKGLQASDFIDPLLVCNTERRVAKC
ncbi:MAG: MauE/DoxX family redox-associated membrane protein [Sphingobacterium siyangense]